ncbi:electron transfer flavoprotein subunit alpha/FixB family protein [Streptomyces sp. YIM S03343]
MTRAFVFSEDARLAAELVTTATTIADQVHLVCLGAPPATPPAGVTSVVVLEDPSDALFDGGVRPEAYAPALARLAGDRHANAVLIGATVSGREIAARVAAILGLGLVSEATTLDSLPDGTWRSERVTYAGATVQTETWQGPAVVTMAQGQRGDRTAAAEPGAGGVPVETVPVQADTRVRVVSRAVREQEAVDLANAARIVCVGMGLGASADLELATGLADALGAEVACTRPVAEDREWLPAERYIGISGVRVRPDLYLGLGVSGQVQHTVGIRDAKVVVGVNTDPDATLFGVSDYAVVGDLREIAPLLTAAVRAARAAGPDARS